MNTFTHASEFEFNFYVEPAIAKGEYSWNECKLLISHLHNIEDLCLKDFDHSDYAELIPKAFTKRYSDAKLLLANIVPPGGTCLMGLLKKESIKEGRFLIIITKAVVFSGYYYYKIDSRFQFMGMCNYEFEIGKLKMMQPEPVAKIKFEGLEHTGAPQQVHLEKFS